MASLQALETPGIRNASRETKLKFVLIIFLGLSGLVKFFSLFAFSWSSVIVLCLCVVFNAMKRKLKKDKNISKIIFPINPTDTMSPVGVGDRNDECIISFSTSLWMVLSPKLNSIDCAVVTIVLSFFRVI